MRRSLFRFITVLCALAGLAVLSGCANSNHADRSTTSALIPTTATVSASTSLPVVSPEANAYTQDIKRTMLAATELAAELEKGGPGAKDPRSAVVYGLRARAQALTARKAIQDAQAPLYEQAARQLRVLLNRAAGAADGETAEIIDKSASRLLSLPVVPDQEAARVLDAVIEDLAALLPQTATATT